MSQKRARLAGFGLLAGLLTACADGAMPTKVLDPSPSFARSSNAPVHMVSGGGKVDFSILGPPAGEETYGFIGILDGDGNAKGEFQSTFTIPDVKFHADVVCVSVLNNDAWLGAIVTQTHDEVAWPVGTQGIIRVRDNGEGANDPPDALGFWVTVPANLCGLRPTGGVFSFLFPWTKGNAQVR